MTLLAGLLLLAVNADTNRLIPLFAIGVFIGFTISQTGLVRHWTAARPPKWLPRALINGIGAFLTATAAIVFLASKFLTGAWVVVVAIPLLMLLFARIQRYYTAAGIELGIGLIPGPATKQPSLVVVPVGGVNRLTQKAISAAFALGDDVIAVTVQPDIEHATAFRDEWNSWNPGVQLEILISPHRSLVQPIIDYIEKLTGIGNRQIAVLIPQSEPRRRRYTILQNQRGLLLAAALRARTDIVVCTLPYRLDC